MSFVKNDSFISSFPVCQSVYLLFPSFPPIFELVMTPSVLLKSSGKTDILALFLILAGKL